MNKVNIENILNTIFNLPYEDNATTNKLISTKFKDMNVDEFDIVCLELKIHDKYQVAFGLGDLTINSTIIDLTRLINDKLMDRE